MPGWKRVAALVGVVIFVALGAFAASRAQQPTDGETKLILDKNALRTKIVELRTEIEVLEMEHDVARASLLAGMQKQSEAAGRIAESMNMRETREALTEARAKLTDMLAKMSKEERAEFVSDAVKEHPIERRQGEDDLTLLCRLEFMPVEQQFYEDAGVDLRALDREKAAFMQTAKELNEKRLGLTDREAEYKAAK